MQTIVTKTFKNWFSFAAIKWAKLYIQRDRRYNYERLRLQVFKDVFHPGLFRSTKVMVTWLKSQDLTNRSVLELGCGSGLISLIAAKKGAITTAVDINQKAIENTRVNAEDNDLKIICYQSDFFSAVPQDERFDYVLANPPYFPSDPSTDYEHAWYCGKDFNYFHEFFDQLIQRPAGESYYMILSDNCDLNSISSIAKEKQLKLKDVYKKNKWGENFIIYEVVEDIAT